MPYHLQYYACGVFGHSYHGCMHYDDSVPESELPCGSWLRASPTRKRRVADQKIEEKRRMCQQFKGNLKEGKVKVKLNFEVIPLWFTMFLTHRRRLALTNPAGADLVFVVETKRSVKEMAIIKDKLGLEYGYYVDAVDSSEKHLSWELLRHLRDMNSLPWLVIGDFNQIIYNSEKSGGVDRADRELNDFREALDDCALRDIGFTGEFVHMGQQLGLGANTDVSYKIKKVCAALMKWNIEKFGNVNTKINETRDKLVAIDMHDLSHEMIQLRKKVSAELDHWLHLEEIMWKQRSRVCDLKEGDQNTKYFHMKASGRRRRNMIRWVRDDGGRIISQQCEVEDVVVNYFSNLFTTMSPSELDDALTGVSDLIDSGCGVWKEEVVHSNFFEFEAEKLLNIPLSILAPNDALVWHYSKDGKYSVKSGYHFIRFYKATLGSTTGRFPRPARGPHARVDTIIRWCCRCKMEEEDECHAIWFSRYTKIIWELVEVDELMRRFVSRDAAGWRNVILHGGVECCPEEVVARAELLLELEGYADSKEKPFAHRGVGVVIRDSNGIVIRSACSQVKQQWEAVVVEAKALILGLRVAVQGYLVNVVVESDCKLLIHMINSKVNHGSYAAMFVK
ncbi:Cytoplasmic protein NCK2 [Bienertia sinuspersici]